MFYIEQLNEQTLKEQQLLAKIKDQADEFIYYFMAPEAYTMALELEQKLRELFDQQKAQPQIFYRYYNLLIKLKFLSLHIWNNDTFLSLIKNHLADILGSDIDINERMTAKVYMIPVLAWPEAAQQTIEVLKQNSQSIGGQPIMIQGEPAPRPPLVKYWLLDYERALGSQRHENIERAQYFARNRNYQNLNEADKIKIKQLLEFYDNLKPLPLLPEEITAGQEMEEEYKPLIAEPRQGGESDFYGQGEEEPYIPEPRRQSPERKYSPPPTASPPPFQPASPSQGGPSRNDSFREQVQEEDLAGPQAARKPIPKLNGNVVDLSNRSDH